MYYLIMYEKYIIGVVTNPDPDRGKLKVKRNVSLYEDQQDWLLSNNFNLSLFVREKLDELIQLINKN